MPYSLGALRWTWIYIWRNGCSFLSFVTPLFLRDFSISIFSLFSLFLSILFSLSQNHLLVFALLVCVYFKVPKRQMQQKPLALQLDGWCNGLYRCPNMRNHCSALCLIYLELCNRHGLVNKDWLVVFLGQKWVGLDILAIKKGKGL